MRLFLAGLVVAGVVVVAACTREITMRDALGQLRIEVAVTDSAHRAVVAQLAIRLYSVAAHPSLPEEQWTAATDTTGRYTDDYRSIWVQDTVRVLVSATPPAGSGLTAVSDSGTGIYQVGGGIPLDTVRLTLILR